MMDEPWFRYERGRGRYRITPRTARGWISFLGFMFLITILPILLLLLLDWPPVVMLAWPALGLIALLLFVKWATGRSDVIDLDKDAAELRELRAWKARHEEN